MPGSRTSRRLGAWRPWAGREPMGSIKPIVVHEASGAPVDAEASGFELRARGLADRFQARAVANGPPSSAFAARTVPRVCPVLLVGAPPVFLAGLRALLAQQSGFHVVGAEAGGASRLQSVGLAYGIVVFAAAAWTDACAQALDMLRAKHPRVRVVLLVADADPGRMQQFLAGGGFAAMPMAAEVETVLAAIRGAHPAVTQAMAADAPVLVPVPVPVPVHRSELSARERLVLRSKVSGHSNKAIAVALDLSVKTVETYYTRGMEKLGLHSRAEALQYGVMQGWLTET